MAFQLSPSVNVTEIDASGIVPAVATSIGGFVGTFQWGPVEQITTISNEADLVRVFAKPNDTVAQSFFSAANFLAYANNLKTVRVVGAAAKNAVASGTAILIKNSTDWEGTYVENGVLLGNSGATGEWAAKYAGVLGNSLKVSMVDSASWSSWTYKNNFDAAPATSDFCKALGATTAHDELHIVVVDEDGLFTGTPGTVLERFAFLSKAENAKKSDGTRSYYAEVISKNSKYIWWMDHTASVESGAHDAWGSKATATSNFKITTGIVTKSLAGGVDDDAPDSNAFITAWGVFENSETVDVNLLITGPASTEVCQAVLALAETRKDCVVFVSPQLSSVYADSVVDDRQNLNINSSYAIMDSGWKYQYDKYNDKYRWVPLNADTAGLCARTDDIADPWFSPAGLNRGQIKNVVKLNWNPGTQADRDTLYQSQVNPVVTMAGQGTVLMGDKTMLTRPSAFDRINVRRLFIVLEKAIATAGKFQLFEFNDAFTRAQFRNLVEPFLRDVQGRRGVYDFKVVCDATNNTAEVIDSNGFVADIFIKPARSINFMQLNFIATRTGVSFTEVAGA